MDKRAKGKRLEKMASAILEVEGYFVERANPKLMFIGPGKVISQSHDFFGKWDLICVPKSKLHTKKLRAFIRFIQVSVWETLSMKLKQVKDFPQGPYTTEIWLWHKEGRNGNFRVLFGPEYKWLGNTLEPIRKTPSPKNTGLNRPVDLSK